MHPRQPVGANALVWVGMLALFGSPGWPPARAGTSVQFIELVSSDGGENSDPLRFEIPLECRQLIETYNACTYSCIATVDKGTHSLPWLSKGSPSVYWWPFFIRSKSRPPRVCLVECTGEHSMAGVLSSPRGAVVILGRKFQDCQRPSGLECSSILVEPLELIGVKKPFIP